MSASQSPRPFRLAINGYGRIGRCFLRALHEAGLQRQFEVVAINEPADVESMVYLTCFDSTHGRFPAEVRRQGEGLAIDAVPVQVSHGETPEAVDWRALDLDLLVECSGRYARQSELARFLAGGCPRVLLSHPGHSAEDVDATVVFGVNQGELGPRAQVVSSASCTTNAVVPVLKLLQDGWGIERGMLTTLHSVMNDQPLIDGYHHTELRRTRSAMQSIIPVSTGLARGVERLLPQLAGRIQAKAVRVPTLNVSAIDVSLILQQDTSAQALNACFAEAAQHGPLAGLLACSDYPHASVDFNHDPHSAIIDASQTRVNGRLVNLLIWFDNEWGYANRMVDVARHWLSLV